MKKLAFFLFTVFITNYCLSQENIYVIIKEHLDIRHFAYKSDTIVQRPISYYTESTNKIN